MKKVLLICMASILLVNVAIVKKKQNKQIAKTYKTEYDSLWKKVGMEIEFVFDEEQKYEKQ